MEGIESIGLDSDLMRKIQELRSAESTADLSDLQSLYEQFMNMIVKAAEMADQI